jgi:hypothetical protein
MIARNQIIADLEISCASSSLLKKFRPKNKNRIKEKIIILGKEFLILKFKKSLNVI